MAVSFQCMTKSTTIKKKKKKSGLCLTTEFLRLTLHLSATYFLERITVSLLLQNIKNHFSSQNVII